MLQTSDFTTETDNNRYTRIWQEVIETWNQRIKIFTPIITVEYSNTSNLICYVYFPNRSTIPVPSMNYLPSITIIENTTSVKSFQEILRMERSRS